jgi:hypothetical protein
MTAAAGIAGLAAALGGWSPAATRAAEATDGLADSVAERLFARDLLAPITAPVILDYAYASEGQGASRREPIHMEVRRLAADGQKEVWFDMFEGAARRSFGPVPASRQNPLVLVFLQRDANGMERATGGSQHYFRNRIREAMRGPAEIDTVPIELPGRRLVATRLTNRPFVDDPRIAQFPLFRDKAYEFVVAAELPGGLYKLATTVPAGGALAAPIVESFTFEGTREP